MNPLHLLFRRRTTRTHTLRRRRGGVAAIEFALTLPVMLLVLMGIVELSLLQSRMYTISRAARDACRIGSGVIEGVDPTGDDIEAAAVDHAQFVLDTAGIDCGGGCTLTADWFEDADTGWMFLRVFVGVPYEPFTGLLPQLADATRSEFVMLTQQQAVE